MPSQLTVKKVDRRRQGRHRGTFATRQMQQTYCFLLDSLFFEQLDREAALLGAADDPLDPTADFAVTESDLVLAEALSHQKDPFTFAEPPVFGLDERVVSTLALRNAAQVIATAHSPIATPTPPSLQVPEEQHLLPASSLPFYLAPPSSPAPPQDVYPPLPTEESIEEIVEQALRDVSSGGFVQTQRLVCVGFEFFLALYFERVGG